MACLRAGPHDTSRVRNVRAALLSGRPQVQVVLEEPPQQLTAARPELLLQLGVRQRCRLLAGQPGVGFLVAGPGPRERLLRPLRVLSHGLLLSIPVLRQPGT